MVGAAHVEGSSPIEAGSASMDLHQPTDGADGRALERRGRPQFYFFRAVLFVLALDAGCATHAVQGNLPPAAVSPSQPAEAEPDVWCASNKLPPVEVFAGVGGSVSSLSERFREAHQRARAKQCTVLATQQLMIRYWFGTLEATWKGVELGRRTNLYTPRVHAIKAVSHSVFLAALLFEEPAGPDRDSHLHDALRDISALLSDLTDSKTDAAKAFLLDERSDQVAILTLTSKALEGFRDGQLDETGRRDYFVSVRRPLTENLRRAAVAVLTAVHEAVSAYKKEVDAKDPTAWASLVFLANVSHQGRARDIVVQYFERLLGETASEGASLENRLVILEGQAKPAAQRAGLAGHDVDRHFGEVIFGDPGRLQWDVMGDSGGFIDSLFPTKKTPK
jgi:hypothetical protein